MTMTNSAIAAAFSSHSTATLYDAARRLGLETGLRAVMPLARNARIAAPAYTMRFAPADQRPKNLLNFYDVIAAAPKGHVLTIQVGADRWVCGSNTTRFAELSGMAGMVMDGCIRDIAAMRDRSYPVFGYGAAVTGYPGALVLSETGGDILCGGVNIATGDIIVGDDDGVVSLPASRLEEIHYEAEEIAWLDTKLERDIEARRPLAELHETRVKWPVRRAAPSIPSGTK
jgi:4-hydroxy-4-methyl-2-oxoglutarate aldolase